MKAVLTIDGYLPIEFEITKLVTLNLGKEIIEVEKMKDGRYRICLTKKFLEEKK